MGPTGPGPLCQSSPLLSQNGAPGVREHMGFVGLDLWFSIIPVLTHSNL
jgi:hypothetical protein